MKNIDLLKLMLDYCNQLAEIEKKLEGIEMPYADRNIYLPMNFDVFINNTDKKNTK